MSGPNATAGDGSTIGDAVHLVTSGASLLSGDLDECNFPQDPSCEAGIATVAAYARYLVPELARGTSVLPVDAPDSDSDALPRKQPTAFIQKFDKRSPFVNMHELQWVVNRLVIHDIFGFDVFLSNPSLLLQNAADSDVSQRDISGLQTDDMPLLLSNSQIPPSLSWYRYTEALHFDRSTGLAIANIADEDVPLYVPQVDAARGLLDLIAKINRENGCYPQPDHGDAATSYDAYLANFKAAVQATEQNRTSVGDATAAGSNRDGDNGKNGSDDNICWISVLLYQDGQDKYNAFLSAVTAHENPPDFILNLEDAYESFPTPQLYPGTNVWVGTCPMDDDVYCQHSIRTSTATAGAQHASRNKRRIESIEFVQRDLEDMPVEYKDDIWDSHITQLHELARDAQQNNPVIGYTRKMPVVRDGEIRYCQAGECAMGNLFTDALRWYNDADFAFVASGGFKGSGWPEGPVRLTDIYATLQFPNSECVGTMTGISIFKMFEYVTRIVPFDAIDSDEGEQLLQVSGIRVTYNTKIEYGSSRLIAIDVWNRQTAQYEPIERLKLYKFVTDSYVCGAYARYPEFTGSGLTLPGEVPGVIGDEELVQNMVSSYLGQLQEPYDTKTQGRLRNNTEVFDVMDILQTEEDCPKNTVWDAISATCLPCPSFENVAFSDELLQFESDNDSTRVSAGRIVLVNREAFDVSVLLKSQPRWLGFTSVMKDDEDQELSDPIALAAGENVVMEFNIRPSNLVALGTDRSAIATVNFGVLGSATTQGCVGRDVTFDVALRVTPADQLNNLGWIRYVGFGLFGLIVTTAVFFAAWVFRNRQTRVVKILQPAFLMCILVGVLVLSSAIIPLSIDDDVASERGCNIACMSVPWLLSSGFIISFCALFCKLWRINRLFNGAQRFRRVVLKMQNVIAPFAVIFALNTAVLFTWTILDPWKWERRMIDGQKWNSYGSCRGGNLSTILASLLGALNCLSLVLSCQQAYIGRNISGEFSESTYIGIAVYGWLQIALVGGPIIYLIDEGNPTATYFIEVALIFIISMSMLLLIFIPGFINKKKLASSRKSSRKSSQLSFTGSIRKDSRERSKVPVLDSIDNISYVQSPPSRHRTVMTSNHLHGSNSLHLQSIQEVMESSESSDSEQSLDYVEAARVRKRQLEQRILDNMHKSVDHNILGLGVEDGDDGNDAAAVIHTIRLSSSDDERGTDKTDQTTGGDDSS